MVVYVQTSDEFKRICEKQVHDFMLKLNKEQEEKMVELMMTCFHAGELIGKGISADVEISNV